MSRLNKNSILFIALHLVSVTCLAQVTGKVTRDSVNNLRFFKAKLSIWEINANPYNFSLYDANVSASMHLGNACYISGEYSYGIGDMLYPSTTDGVDPVTTHEIVSVNKSTHSNAASLEATFFFTKKITKKNLKVRLYTIRKFRRTTGYFTQINGSKMNRMGFRAGFRKGITWYAMDEKTTVSGVPFGSSGLQKESFNYPSMTDMIDYMHVNAGFCISEMTNLHADIEGFGNKSNARLNFIYLDAVYALKSDLDDVYVGKVRLNDTLLYQRYTINEYTPKSKLGFNMGYRSMPTYGNGFGYLTELGYFPGVKKGLNFFLRAGISYYFGSKP